MSILQSAPFKMKNRGRKTIDFFYILCEGRGGRYMGWENH